MSFKGKEKLIELLYVKAEEQVKEDKKKRKVLAALWVLPFCDGFVDKVYKKGFRAINVNPKQTINFATKEIPLFTKGILVITASVCALVSVIRYRYCIYKYFKGKIRTRE